MLFLLINYCYYDERGAEKIFSSHILQMKINGVQFLHKKGVYAMRSNLLFGLLCCLPLVACDSEQKAPETYMRANIIDRNGVVLAENISTADIMLFTSRIKETDADAVAQIIHETFPTDYSVSDALNLIHSGKKVIFIKKLATESQIQKIKEITQKYDYCFQISKNSVRNYPQKTVFSHIVGFVGKDNKGLDGVEYAYNEYLDNNKEPLQLSVDSRIQKTFHEQLTDAMNKYHAKGAMGVLMNSKTGEIIAMVQIPDFDPNNLDDSPVFDRMFKPMRGVYEMGSVFKVFNTAMAYENGLADKQYTVNLPYVIRDKYGKELISIKDVPSTTRYFERNKIEKLTADDIFVNASNVGTARIALDLPDGAQKEFFHRLHFDERLDLNFGKTEKGLMPRKWGPIERATVSFGLGIAVTPMHLLAAVNAVTNGGTYVYPTISKDKAKQGERILSSEISGKLRNIMLRVVEETSGRQAKIKGIEIGGKTGTAEKRVDGKMNGTKVITTFVAVFPVSDPQYTMLTLLDEPQGTKESAGLKTSAWNVVPTAGKILEQIVPMLIK